MRAAAFLAAGFALVSVCLAEEPEAENPDNTILALALQRSYKDDGFTVVAPDTARNIFWSRDPELVEQHKNRVKQKLKIEGCDVNALVDALFEKNANPARLSLKSSPENGYIVDYKGKYKKYFEAEGG